MIHFNIYNGEKVKWHKIKCYDSVSRLLMWFCCFDGKQQHSFTHVYGKITNFAGCYI